MQLVSYSGFYDGMRMELNDLMVKGFGEVFVTKAILDTVYFPVLFENVTNFSQLVSCMVAGEHISSSSALRTSRV